jgi:hypothetical protein
MGRDARLNACPSGPVPDDQLSASRVSRWPAAEVEKYRLGGSATRRKLAPSIERVDHGLANRNQSGLVALAVPDYQHAGLAIDVIPVQRHGLADPQSG